MIKSERGTRLTVELLLTRLPGSDIHKQNSLVAVPQETPDSEMELCGKVAGSTLIEHVAQAWAVKGTEKQYLTDLIDSVRGASFSRRLL
jgi:hypothetical protein